MGAILDALQLHDARLSLGDSWMVWDEVNREWVVYSHPYGLRTRVVGRSEDEDRAVWILTGKQESE